MRKKIDKNDFDEKNGSMEKISIFEALSYTGLTGKRFLSPDEYRTVISKKKKMVRSDIKRQRSMSKVAKKIDWKNNENK